MLRKLLYSVLLLAFITWTVVDAATSPEDHGSHGGFSFLYQTRSRTQPAIHYNTGTGWTKQPMQPSAAGGNLSSANGWFQYDLPTASFVQLAFSDGGGVWDERIDVDSILSAPGTYMFSDQDNDSKYVTGAGYSVVSASEKGGVLTIHLAVNFGLKETSYGDDIAELLVEVDMTARENIQVKVTDKNAPRWEVPTSLFPAGSLGKKASTSAASTRLYEFNYTNNPFTFQVSRKSDGNTLFDSSGLSLVMKDQYLQVSTTVGSDVSVYGIGESTRDTFKMVSGEKYTLWARDQISSEPNVNTYGSHPFFLGVNTAGQAHGVLLLNSNGMDVTMEKDCLVYQVIGGVLDFNIMVGPTPTDVISQYTNLIGRPKLMPYWSYGFHQCRWGYTSVKDLRTVVKNYVDNKLPLDVIWSDIDYMDRFHDFTVDTTNFSGLAAFMDELHATGRKFVPIIDPGIPSDVNDYAYRRGLEMDIFIKSPSGDPFLGQVWPGPTFFPDFLHPNTSGYWSEQLGRLHTSVIFDGLWIDMNELANFCPGVTCVRDAFATCPRAGNSTTMTTCCLSCVANETKYDHPPFAINNVNKRDPIYNKAVSPNALQSEGIRQYDSHNLYGLTESIVTNSIQEELTNKRSFVLSRSTFPGSGVHVAHWTGDNAATWNDLRWSIPAILKFGLFGIPMVGADICGFSGTSNMELCARWTALGSFYPFSRNHNILGAPSQETYVWPEVVAVGRKFIGMRYRLLPYIYTLGYHAHKTGVPIARSLLMEFPADTTTHSINHQFMLGDALLITPVLVQAASSVTGYFPKGIWYDMFDYSRIETSGAAATLPVTLYDMPVHIRGGCILAMHQAALTTAAARLTSFDIVIALSNQGEANGDLYLDDGEQINNPNATILQFQAALGVFTSIVQRSDDVSTQSRLVSKIIIFGVKTLPLRVSLGVISNYNATSQRLEISVAGVNQMISSNFTVAWG